MSTDVKIRVQMLKQCYFNNLFFSILIQKVNEWKNFAKANYERLFKSRNQI